MNKEANKTLHQQMKHKSLYNYTVEEMQKAMENVKEAFPVSILDDTKNNERNLLGIVNTFTRSIQYHYNSKYFDFSDATNKVLNKIQIDKWYSTRLDQGKIVKLISSKMLYSFIQNLDNFITKKTNKKFFLYSGHDDNIIGILISILSNDFMVASAKKLNIFYNFLQPGFASGFIIEMHSYKKYKSDRLRFLSEDQFMEDYFVRILYNGRTLRTGFNTNLKYNYSLDGIEFINFRSHIMNYIDYDFQTLYCVRTDLEEKRLSLFKF